MPKPATKHPLEATEAEVERTHPGLGRLVAFAVLCAKARRCLLIVAPPGCGKSTSTATIGGLLTNTVVLDSVTRSGLQYFQGDWTNGSQAIIIDDLAKVDGEYSRTQTLTTLCEMTFSHFVSKHSHQLSIQIDRFHGSTTVNVQPGILRTLIGTDEFDASVADKSIRYYHLYRPTKPDPGYPVVTLRLGRSVERTDPPTPKLRGLEDCLAISRTQHTEARALEHCRWLLRASAALDNRQHPTPKDARVVARLMRPMSIEEDLFQREDLEGPRKMNASVLPILTEFATHKNPTLELISRNYRLSIDRVRRIIKGMPNLFAVVDKQPTTIGAKLAIVEMLAKSGDPHFQKQLKEIRKNGVNQRTVTATRDHARDRRSTPPRGKASSGADPRGNAPRGLQEGNSRTPRRGGHQSIDLRRAEASIHGRPPR